MKVCPRCTAERDLAAANVIATRAPRPYDNPHAEAYGYLVASLESLLREDRELKLCARHRNRRTEGP